MTTSFPTPAVSRAERWAALPAAVALVACLGATLVQLLRPSASDPATLLRRADADYGAGRFETAVLRYQHAMALLPDDPEPAYRLALATDRLGHRSEAMQILALIAPAIGGGYPPAHLQQADWLIEAHVLGGTADPSLLTAARAHLAGPFPDAASQRRAAELLAVLDTDRGDRTPATRPARAAGL